MGLSVGCWASSRIQSHLERAGESDPALRPRDISPATPDHGPVRGQTKLPGAQAPGSSRNPQSKPRHGPVLAFICVDLCLSVVKGRELELIHQVAVAPSLAAGAGVRLAPIGTPVVGLPDRIAGPAHGPPAGHPLLSVAIRVHPWSKAVDTSRGHLPRTLAVDVC